MDALALPALIQGREADALAAMVAGIGCIGGLFVILLLMAFPIFCFWRIFTKAGYSGAMALIWLIPVVGPLIVICILAFGAWPSHRQP